VRLPCPNSLGSRLSYPNGLAALKRGRKKRRESDATTHPGASIVAGGSEEKGALTITGGTQRKGINLPLTAEAGGKIAAVAALVQLPGGLCSSDTNSRMADEIPRGFTAERGKDVPQCAAPWKDPLWEIPFQSWQNGIDLQRGRGGGKSRPRRDKHLEKKAGEMAINQLGVTIMRMAA